MAVYPNNILCISEEMVNRDLRARILSAAGGMVTDYTVSFSGGYLFLEATLSVPKLGPLSAKYRLNIRDFTFHKTAHTVYLDYDEDVKPAGGAMQSMLLKAAGLAGGTYLQKALSMAARPGLRADGKSCSVDLDQLLDLSGSLVASLTLTYDDCRDKALRFQYGLTL